jgi:hydroxypyruvate isomerase
MRFSPCIDALFFHKEIPVYDQILLLKRCGFRYFEFWSWWDKDLEMIERAMKDTGMEVTAICTKFISLVDENLRDQYVDGVLASLDVAKRLGARMIISQVGDEIGIAREKQYASIVSGLKACEPYLAESGISLVIEPLNHLVDHPGYYLTSSDEAAQIIKEVNSPAIKMLFDVYHQQVSEGHVSERLKKYLPYIGHIHIADNPGRDRPGTGELDYAYILQQLKSQYDGYIGLEYFPREDVEESLLKFQRLVDEHLL